MGYLEMVAALKQLIYGASRPYTRVESRFSSHTGRIVSAISHRWVIMRKGQCIPLEPLYRSPKMSFWKIFSLGQLLRSTDPEDIATIYTYDALGRLTRRVHPDAGATHYSYDPAGNLIAEENPLGQIFYDYTYYRLAGKRYGNMSGNDVIYEYGTEGTATGLPVRINDGSGVLTLEYDAMGNVSKSVRVSSVPTSGIAFAFTHSFLYDSWGRMLQMTYPDGESVHYEYNRAGDLLRMYGEKNNHSRIYIDDIGYNKYGQRTHVDYGNGARTEYSYDPLRRLDRLRSRDAHNRILQEIGYSYDRVSNITQTRNTASVIDGMGGAFENNYVYDGLDRLVYAFGDSREGHAVDYKLDEMRYSASGRVGSKIQWWSTEAGHGAQHLVYGYVASGEKPHAPRLIADHATDSRYGLQWDPAGNLIQVIAHGDAPAFAARFHYWTEDNRLHTVADDRSYSYYAYDHTGQRVLKLTGASDQLDINADFLRTHTVLTEPTLYPSPYIVLSNHGYTKHYYAGSERVAARIGGGNLDHDTACIVADEEATERADRLFDWCLRQVKETAIAPLDLSSLDIRTIDGDRMDAPWWLDEAPAGLEAGLKLNVWKLLHAMDLLSSPSTVPPDTDDEPDVYFYHSDHLGSASWITEAGGKPVQHIQYLPYGEPFVNQHPVGYQERYTFTGKERDEETGYSYFGARYMDHELMTMWLSADPMADKYPSISPYAYCAWNPVKLVDPDGREVYITGDAAEQATSQLSSKGIKVSRDERTGKLSYTKTGEELTASDNQLIAAIDSKDVKVNVNATNALKVPFEDISVDNSERTGQFQGVIVSDCDNRIANTKQLVNPATCEKRDKKCKVLLGTSMRHEITESYQAGLICIDEGISCSPSWSEFNGFTIRESVVDGKKSVYRRAHERATKQAMDILKERVRYKKSQAKANARARAEMNARLMQNNNTLFP